MRPAHPEGDLAVTRAIDGLVRRAFPHPIAAAWHRASLTTSDADRIKHLLACQEVLLRTLVAQLLPDYLAGPAAAPVEELLPRLERPAMGHWVGLVREILRTVRERDRPPFCPEAADWYFTPKGKPSQAARLLDSLVSLRNEEAHGRALSPKETAARAAQLLGDLKALLGGMAWMTAYRPFRVVEQRARRRGGHAGKVQFLVGVEPQTQPQSAAWSAGLFQDAVWLANPAGDTFLELSPALQVLYDAGPRAERVFLLAHTKKSKKLVLKHDATGAEEHVLVHIEEESIPWDRWLEERDVVRLENPGKAGVFEASEWRPASEDGHDLGERFEVKEALGQGGMATVFRVWDTWDEQEFALKVLHAELTTDRAFRERFRREAQMMRRLDHPNVLRVVETGQLEDGRVYLKLPLVTAGTLAERITTGGAPHELVLGWAAQMLSGLAHAHAQGVVHRDVKPENFLLDEHGAVFLADFGIALREDDTRLTKSMEQVGSLAYMSPEQRLGRELDAASDIFSLGVVLHELLSGELGPASPGKGLDAPWGDLVRAMTADEPSARPDAAGCLSRLELPAPEAPGAPAPPAPSESVRYHHHGPDGQAERTLDEVVAAVRKAPDGPHLLWRPGWTSWRPHTDVTEVAQALGGVQAPAAPPPVPGGPSLDVVELAPGAFGMGPERARQVQLSRGFVVGLALEEIGGLSWYDAIRRCNALSAEFGLDPAYRLSEPEPRKAWSMDDMGRVVYDLLGFELIQPVMEHFGREVLEVLQFRPQDLGVIKGVGPKRIERIAAAWNPDEYYVCQVEWDFAASGWRLPTEAEWEYASQVHHDVLEGGTRLEWVWDRAGKTWTDQPPPLPAEDAADPKGAEVGDKRVLRGLGQADVRRCWSPWERNKEGGLRVARWA